MLEPALILGRTIGGKYLVQRLLGTGGIGAVFEAVHVDIEKRVAIKVIDVTHEWAPTFAARLRQEAYAASAVQSEHVLEVFDVGEDRVFGVYMVMELLVGDDLAARLRTGRLDPTTAATVVYQAAATLARVHAEGVIHRDIKPANLFLVARGDGGGGLHVKVLDFGLAKIVRDKRARGRATLVSTAEGTVIGTPEYMSPEQAQGLAIVDARTDVWALGCVLYECLAGAPAYQSAPTPEQTLLRILSTRPPSLTTVAPWVPTALIRVAEEALEPDLARRLQDCATLARRIAESVPAAAASSRASSTPPPALISTQYAVAAAAAPGPAWSRAAETVPALPRASAVPQVRSERSERVALQTTLEADTQPVVEPRRRTVGDEASAAEAAPVEALFPKLVAPPPYRSSAPPVGLAATELMQTHDRDSLNVAVADALARRSTGATGGVPARPAVENARSVGFTHAEQDAPRGRTGVVVGIAVIVVAAGAAAAGWWLGWF